MTKFLDNFEITKVEPIYGEDIRFDQHEKISYRSKWNSADIRVSIGNYTGSECFDIAAQIDRHYDKNTRSMSGSLNIPYAHPNSIEWLTEIRDTVDRAILHARKAHGEPVTDPRFLRCRCENHPIWLKSDLEWESNEAWRNSGINPQTRNVQCPLCHQEMREMPNAYKEDIGRGGLFATDASFISAYNISEYYDSLDAFDCARGKNSG